MVLVAPQRRRPGTGRRRRVRLQRREQLPDEAPGRPAEESDRAARAAHPDQLVRSALVVRREHHADAGQHHVEAAVGVGQRLGVALVPPHRHAVAGGELPSRGEQLRGQVGGGDPGAGQRGRDRRVPGARGHVEHPVPGAHPARRDEHRPQLRDHVGGHGRVVAQRPGRPVARLQRPVRGDVDDLGRGVSSSWCSEPVPGTGGTPGAGTVRAHREAAPSRALGHPISGRLGPVPPTPPARSSEEAGQATVGLRHLPRPCAVDGTPCAVPRRGAGAVPRRRSGHPCRPGCSG